MPRACILLGALLLVTVAQAQTISERCPAGGIVRRTADFSPQGIILTYFDGSALWVYDIARSTRYPLPETTPCVSNCRLSPDARWITYLNPRTQGYMKMRLDGTQRTPIMDIAADVIWAANGELLVWTPDHRAFYQPEGGTVDQRRFLPTDGVVTIMGDWAVRIALGVDGFNRYLINFDVIQQPDATYQPLLLTADTPFFNAAAWSPDGRYLAFVQRAEADAAGRRGAELAVVSLDVPAVHVLTNFSANGAVRINGASPSSLSWSPDSRRVAYWVLPMNADDPAAVTGQAFLHMTDVSTRETVRYCGFSTSEHTPNPPTLVWSPDSTHLAFGGNVEGDGRGYLLLALNVETGQFTELSDGIFPALGQPDVLAWGHRP
jgi:dipeptidyl aminopeptidase/acylaminoacyl peptidase